MASKEGLLSVEKVAEFLGVSKKSVYRLVKKGLLSAFKVEGIWRFTEEDVEAYLEQTRTRLRQPYHGRVFHGAVLTKYHQVPRKYQITQRGTFSWLGLAGPYLMGLAPAEQSREEFRPVKYRRARLPNIGSAIIVRPGYFVRLPPAEQEHWLKFEIKPTQ